jgi:glutathione peroxidase
MSSSVFDFDADRLDGAKVSLDQYRGKVLLIVNTASQCGHTPQYQALQQLHQRYQTQGFEVLGFPCNQFGKQEPGSATEIGAFCESKYGITFPLFAKIEVNGKHAHPLFKHLKNAAPGIFGTQSIKWNFTKFLVNKDGTVYQRYAARTAPDKLIGDIEKLLAA